MKPWLSEPNREEFKHADFPCLVQRGPSGAWCGYVAVPPGNRFHGKGYSGTYDENDNYINSPVDELSVHGGVTYAAECSEGNGICHVPPPGEPDNVWWIGFDCAHSGDFCPKHHDPDSETNVRMKAQYPDWDCKPFEWSATYKDIDYVKHQTRRLAEQLRELS